MRTLLLYPRLLSLPVVSLSLLLASLLFLGVELPRFESPERGALISTAPVEPDELRQPVLRVPQDYPTIQAAIDAAPEGATIQIAPGSYTENLTISKSLTLEGSGAEATILEPVRGFRDHDDHNPVITVQAVPEQEIALRLSRLTIRQPSESLGNRSNPFCSYDGFDKALGFKAIGESRNKMKLVIEQTKWVCLGFALSAPGGLQRLKIRESAFERNAFNFFRFGDVEEAEIIGNMVLENIDGIQLRGSKRLHVQNNTVIGSRTWVSRFTRLVTPGGIALVLAEGGQGEVIGNFVVFTEGISLGQQGEMARWKSRRNVLLNNSTNLYITALPLPLLLPTNLDLERRLDVLVEENRMIGGNNGVVVNTDAGLSGALGEVRLHRNYIHKQYMQDIFRPEERSEYSGHGISIWSVSGEWPKGGPLKIEISENWISENEGWGVVINPTPYQIAEKRCKPPDVPPLIVGKDNIIEYNFIPGDLCPADYPWPPVFRN